MYLRRLLLREFLRPPDMEQSYPELPNAFKVCCVSATDKPRDAEIVTWAQSLASKERGSFRSGMGVLLKLANAGRRLESHYDEKQCHPAHRFTYKRREHVVWRIRSGDLRILFCYCDDRILLITDTFPKRKDKLTVAQKLKSERTIKAFIDTPEVLFTGDNPNEE